MTRGATETVSADADGSPARAPRLLLIGCLVVYGLTTYGGVRSPDSEVVVRTAEALTKRGTFAVDKDLETWKGFGLATGTDGRRYSVFGPLESVLLVPFVGLAEAVNAGNWYRNAEIPLSHYSGQGGFHIVADTSPKDLEPHAVRLICSMFNVLVGMLCVWAFFSLVFALTRDRSTSLLLSFLFGFGTPFWSYSGTLFSEPLAALFVILSLRFLIRGGASRSACLWSGTMLGLAITAHLTAVLFAPFFLFYAFRRLRCDGVDRRELWRGLASFAGAVGCFLLLLGLYNLLRFGDPLETGRGVADELQRTKLYGHFTWPWDGLKGLLVSPGKSLFFYVPAVLAALCLWPRFHRAHPGLSWAIGGAVLFRFLFIASRSDWHGGWSLGPRYLMLAVPLLLVPIAPWLRDRLASPNPKVLAAVFLFCFATAAQQLYLVIGEQFTRNRVVVRHAKARGLQFDLNYEFDYTPLGSSLDTGPGPYLLGRLPLSNQELWLIGVLLLAAALGIWWWRLRAALPSEQSPSSTD